MASQIPVILKYFPGKCYPAELDFTQGIRPGGENLGDFWEKSENKSTRSALRSRTPRHVEANELFHSLSDEGLEALDDFRGGHSAGVDFHRVGGFTQPSDTSLFVLLVSHPLIVENRIKCHPLAS